MIIEDKALNAMYDCELIQLRREAEEKGQRAFAAKLRGIIRHRQQMAALQA